jgi:hypothetical protein
LQRIYVTQNRNKNKTTINLSKNQQDFFSGMILMKKVFHQGDGRGEKEIKLNVL